jgi:hypothetical protein
MVRTEWEYNLHKSVYPMTVVITRSFVKKRRYFDSKKRDTIDDKAATNVSLGNSCPFLAAMKIP